MNLQFTEEELLIQETVRQFAENSLDPVAEKMDKEDYWPNDVFKEFGELGLLAPTIDEKYGGSGLGYRVQAIILEELAKISPAFALSVGAHSNLTLDNINRNATESQKQRFLPKLCSGEWVGSLALTEPGSGSDALGMNSTARIEGDYYILNGSKTFITNAPLAKIAIVYAKTDPNLGSKGVSAFLVDLDSEGVSRGKAMDKMGMRGSKTGELFFDNVRVPLENLMGVVNHGHKVVMSGLSAERAVLAAISLGISEQASKLALKYALERNQFGQKIADFQMIKEKLANMFVETQASKLLVYWAINELELNHSNNIAPASSILYAAEKSTQTSLQAVQILGGYGYMREYKVEKLARDAKLLEIGAGTSEIRRLIIANRLIRDGKYPWD